MDCRIPPRARERQRRNARDDARNFAGRADRSRFALPFRPSRRSRIPRIAIVAAAAALTGACAALAANVSSTPEFRPHDRWSVVGDSITQYGTYYAWIYLYEATRFPDLDLQVTNAGISGDSAAGAVKRYAWDIKPARPTVASIMLGMNDVDRDRYSDGPATPEVREIREAALRRYRDSLEQLVISLQRDGSRVILVTPSPFDETVQVDFPRHTGVNGALAHCADFMRELAATRQVALIDLHGPMTDLNARLQSKDPKATLIGPDRVHPGISGHLVMAYFFLRALGAPAVVSRLELDAAHAREVATENVTVSELTTTNRSVEFTCAEKALPFPVPDEARAALEWVPFQRELNQEVLKISGLIAGRYTLLIDAKRVGEFDAEQLRAGVNLAELSESPQLLQARAVLKLVREWQDLVANGQRAIAEVEHWKVPQLAHPVSFEAARPLLLTELERLKQAREPNVELNRSNIERYLKLKPQEPKIVDRIHDLEARIRVAARPKPHRYQIVRLGREE